MLRKFLLVSCCVAFLSNSGAHAQDNNKYLKSAIKPAKIRGMTAVVPMRGNLNIGDVYIVSPKMNKAGGYTSIKVNDLLTEKTFADNMASYVSSVYIDDDKINNGAKNPDAKAPNTKREKYYNLLQSEASFNDVTDNNHVIAAITGFIPVKLLMFVLTSNWDITSNFHSGYRNITILQIPAKVFDGFFPYQITSEEKLKELTGLTPDGLVYNAAGLQGYKPMIRTIDKLKFKSPKKIDIYLAVPITVYYAKTIDYSDEKKKDIINNIAITNLPATISSLIEQSVKPPQQQPDATQNVNNTSSGSTDSLKGSVSQNASGNSSSPDKPGVSTTVHIEYSVANKETFEHPLAITAQNVYYKITLKSSDKSLSNWEFVNCTSPYAPDSKIHWFSLLNPIDDMGHVIKMPVSLIKK